MEPKELRVVDDKVVLTRSAKYLTNNLCDITVTFLNLLYLNYNNQLALFIFVMKNNLAKA